MTVAASASRFDEVIDRRASNSMKWAGAQTMLGAEEAAADPLPMWVADMDFRAPQPVIDALVEAAQKGVFGYPNGAPGSYVAAVVDWQRRRFGWELAPEWVVQSSGIITAIKTIVQAFSAPGDGVLIQPPVYAHFRDDGAADRRRARRDRLDHRLALRERAGAGFQRADRRAPEDRYHEAGTGGGRLSADSGPATFGSGLC